MATTKWSAADLRRELREVVVAPEDGDSGDELVARERAVEHADRGVEPAGEDGVEHLPALVGPADHDDAAHDAALPLPRNGSIVAWPGALTP